MTLPPVIAIEDKTYLKLHKELNVAQRVCFVISTCASSALIGGLFGTVGGVFLGLLKPELMLL